MQLKILFENIKHHLILSFFILFTSIIIVTSITLSIETNAFLYHVTSDEYRLANHDMDIIIKSNTGLSLKGTRGDSNEYETSYERRTSFYNVTLLAKSNERSNIVQIFEGTNEDINTAFNQNLNINANEIVITENFASRLNVSTFDNVDLYIGDDIVTYQVVGIIEGNGIYAGESAFITGYNVASYYALKKMYNLIMLDIKDNVDYDAIYNHIKNKYSVYTVVDINDSNHIESLSSSSLDELLMIVTIVFIVILVLLLKMFSQKTKKQKDYFLLIGKNNYYKIYQLLGWLLIITLSIIGSIILSNVFIGILINIYNCRTNYIINNISYIYGLLPLVVVLLFRLFVTSNINIRFNKIYIMILTSITLILVILMLLFKNSYIFSLMLLLLIIVLSLLIIEIIYKISKYILPYTHRIYIYDLNKKTFIFRLLQFIYIFIIVLISMVISTMKVYNNQIEELSELIKIDSVVATKTIYTTTNVYEQIQIDNNVNLYETNLNVVLGLNATQYEEYLEYPSLLEDEKQKFNSNHNYIILPKYYENTYHLEVGDSIELLINEKTESFEILKFVNRIYYKMAVINHSDYMYYGYVIDSDNLSDDIITSFKEYKYSIINFKDSIYKHQNLYNNILHMVRYTLIIIIAIIILLSIYIAYQEHLYQEYNLKKLKLLGLDNNKMMLISSIKLLYNLIVCGILGFVSSRIILANFDDVAKNFNTIFYIEYDFKVVMISIFITFICLFISHIYSNIKYKSL